MKIKKCTVCGQEFESYNGIEVCSDECFQKRKREMEREANYRRRKGLSCVPITYTCPICGKEFEGLREKYCSDECRKIARERIMHENNKWYYENRKKR